MPLTPEQARDLVKHFGSLRAASRGTGVPFSTIQYWASPSPGIYQQRWREKNREKHQEQNRRAQARYMARAENRALKSKTSKERYYRRQYEGLCVFCGKEPLLTSASCWNCLLKREEADNARRYGSYEA